MSTCSAGTENRLKNQPAHRRPERLLPSGSGFPSECPTRFRPPEGGRKRQRPHASTGGQSPVETAPTWTHQQRCHFLFLDLGLAALLVHRLAASPASWPLDGFDAALTGWNNHACKRTPDQSVMEGCSRAGTRLPVCWGRFHCTCWTCGRRDDRLAILALTLLVERDQAVNLVGIRDVQLSPLHHLAELRALVEGAAQPGLPGRRVVLDVVGQFPFKLRPRLHSTKTAKSQRPLTLKHKAELVCIPTLKMAASSSLRKSCFPACFQGMRNMVLSSSSHTRPGYLPLSTCKTIFTHLENDRPLKTCRQT